MRLQVVPTTDLTKNGPWGGNEGFPRDTKEKPMRLESVTIRYEGLIDSFQFSYTDQSGNKQTEGPWGAGGPAGASTETVRVVYLVDFSIYSTAILALIRINCLKFAQTRMYLC